MRQRRLSRTANDAPILICYDGSAGAEHAITAAAALLARPRAVVVDVGPLALVAEVFAADGSGAAEISRIVFEQAVARAEAGAALARAAGFRAEARGTVDGPSCSGSSVAAGGRGAVFAARATSPRPGLLQTLALVSLVRRHR